MNQEIKKEKTYYLWWHNAEDGKRTPAGVAFFNSGFGEYRLRIDSLELFTEGDKGLERAQVYCKMAGSSQDKIEYRIEKVIKKPGKKFLRRALIGTGFSAPSTGGEILMDIPPFTSKHQLILVEGGHA